MTDRQTAVHIICRTLTCLFNYYEITGKHPETSDFFHSYRKPCPEIDQPPPEERAPAQRLSSVA
jgi:hypothetical protein